MEKVFCTTCTFRGEFEPDEMGATEFQIDGECPLCGSPTMYANGILTKEAVFMSVGPANIFARVAGAVFFVFLFLAAITFLFYLYYRK